MGRSEREALAQSLAQWRRLCWERYVGPLGYGATTKPARPIDVRAFAVYHRCEAAHTELL